MVLYIVIRCNLTHVTNNQNFCSHCVIILQDTAASHINIVMCKACCKHGIKPLKPNILIIVKNSNFTSKKMQHFFITKIN
jgi:hypothetical protein